MKTNILSLLAIAGLLTFAGCANDDTANKDNEQEPGTEGLTSFVEEDNSTRTTAEYDGSGLNFFWTAGDRLWVNTGTALAPVLTQDSQNNIASKLENNPANASAVKRAAKAKFWFAGTFTASSYPVRYTGKNGAKDKVTIKSYQIQNIPNDASHIGEDGDFGVATATKPAGGDKYQFTLDHKAAYITFMPYTNQGVVAGAQIRKIRVFTGNTSDALAGTFDLTDNGTLSNAVSTSNSVELSVSDFSIPSTSTYATNAATMVVNPGTYNNVSIEYTVHDPVTHVIGTITKTYPSVTFTAGRNKKVKTDLQVKVYPQDVYYMWDAQLNYWYGNESSQPKPENPAAPSDNSWPQSKTADPTRWYNDVTGYHDPSGTAPAILPTTSHFQACPNVNELCWYIQEGDPHWDTELWATMGHLYVGGMWFRKQSVIAAAQSPIKTVAELKAAAPDGTDYTRSTNYPSYTNTIITSGKPSNLNDYFHLPALGYYNSGALDFVGGNGFYWSSTPTSWLTNVAYGLSFSNTNVTVGGTHRYFGIRVWTAQ